MAKQLLTSHLVVKISYFLFVAAVVTAVLYSLWLIAIPLVAAVLLSFLFDPVINYFETKGTKRFNALVWLTVSLIGVLAIAALFLIPKLIGEAQNIISNMPQYKILMKDALQKIQELLQAKFPQASIPDLYQLAAQRLSAGGKIDFNSVISHLSSFFSVLSIVVLIPVITFFLLADGHLMHKFLYSMVPNRYFEMFILLAHRITTALKHFLRGQLIETVTVSILTCIGLSAIGLPYALLIGIIAGFGNLIPYLGPVIGFLPALVVVLLTGFKVSLLIAVIVVFVVVQFIDSTFVFPIAVGKSVNIHPLVVIIAITVGGQVGGIIGMLVAIPIISVAKVSLEVLHTYLKAYSII
jgi:predicted PurR-regulated permease PerM